MSIYNKTGLYKKSGMFNKKGTCNNDNAKLFSLDTWYNPHVAEKSAEIMVRETIESRFKALKKSLVGKKNSHR